MTTEYRNWKIETDEDGIAWLGMDKAESSANVLSTEVLAELDSIIDGIAKSPPKALILQSLKDSGFIAGADVKEFTTVKDEKRAFEFIRRGQSVFDKIERLSIPTVVMIHGYCLGGGLELSLAFKTRVASSDPSTRLGFPEVLLGIHPGFGGSVRSTRVMGGIEAMKIMLTGKTLDGRKAKKLGLVDFCVPRRNLKAAALGVVKGTAVKKSAAPLASRLSNLPLVRSLVSQILVRETEKKARPEHYPAPFALIDLWKDNFSPKETMMEEEARNVSRLVCGPTAQNLIRVFFLQERMKSLGAGSPFKPERVHVIGAGVMGGDIAAWLALRGYKVTLQDTDAARIAPAIKRADKLFTGKLKEPRLARAAMDRLQPDMKGGGVSSADIVVEAIFENLEAKKSLYADVEPRMKPGAILATNTSSIMLEKLEEGLLRPDRFVGLHFFNPVAMMKLVEVVKGPSTAPEVAAMTASFVRNMDKLPLIVKSIPGFLVNRILTPYLYEAMKLASEGVPIQVIDKAAVDFGMPMGPVTLADTVGLDICLSVISILGQELGMEVPERLESMVKAGKLGKKSGAGFYEYNNGKQVKPETPHHYDPPKDVQDRLILKLVDQSVRCLREEVVEDADLLDAGVIFGTGFAPFRGGPLKYASDTGHDKIVEVLKKMEADHGPRFGPDEGWQGLSS